MKHPSLRAARYANRLQRTGSASSAVAAAMGCSAPGRPACATPCVPCWQRAGAMDDADILSNGETGVRCSKASSTTSRSMRTTPARSTTFARPLRGSCPSLANAVGWSAC